MRGSHQWEGGQGFWKNRIPKKEKGKLGDRSVEGEEKIHSDKDLPSCQQRPGGGKQEQGKAPNAGKEKRERTSRKRRLNG